MRRTSIKVYVYDITIDGVTKRHEYSKKLDYKASLREAYKNGHTMWIKLVDSYYWNE